jgi:hypothetical protein
LSNPSGKYESTGSGLWSGTIRNRIVAVSLTFLFVALGLLALVDLDVVLEILAFLGGALLGGALAYLAARPFASMAFSLSPLRRTVAGRILGISLALGVVLLTVSFTGASFPLQEGGVMRCLVLGLALGSAMGVFRRFSRPLVGAEQEPRG